MEWRRVRIVVAYDGTGFSGFQRQPGRCTIQGVLEEALTTVCGEAVKVVGAGRTDAGVHARGQVAHFDVGWPGPVERLPVILHPRLPRSVAVREARVVSSEFHARYGARFRRYGYALRVSRQTDPLSDRFAVRVPLEMNLAAMRMAAAYLPGRRDFRAFMSAIGPDEEPDPVRNLQSVRWLRRGQVWILIVQADGFLRHMVRNMMGGLMQVGAGAWTPEEFSEFAAAGDRSRAPQMAPPEGLCLLQVGYGDRGASDRR